MCSEIRVDASSGYIVVVPPCEIDAVVAPAVQAQLLAALGSASRLVVDLSEVSFIDSTGLSALVVARKRALSAGGEVVLVGVQPRVRRVLQITRLDTLFRMLAGISELDPKT